MAAQARQYNEVSALTSKTFDSAKVAKAKRSR